MGHYMTGTRALMAIAGLFCAAFSVQALEPGAYFRPTGAQVSGYPDATTPYVRSPCPALNALANHGHIPRDGKNISRMVLKAAIMSIYNLDDGVATTLTNAIPDPVSLAFLSTHNVVEHDASLAHSDSDSGADPAELDPELWGDLLDRATEDRRLGVAELADARRDRLWRCEAKGRGCDFGPTQRMLAYSEAALILLNLGGPQTAAGASIRVDDLVSFFVDERIPEGYEPPPVAVTMLDLQAMAAMIQQTQDSS